MTQALTTKLKSLIAAFTALALSLALVPASAFAADYPSGGASATITITGDDVSTSNTFTVYKIASIDLNDNNTTSLEAAVASISSALSAWAKSDGSSTAASDLISAVTTAGLSNFTEMSVTTSSYSGGGVVLSGTFTPGVYYIVISGGDNITYSPNIVSIEPTYSDGEWTGNVTSPTVACKSASSTISKTVESSLSSTASPYFYQEGDTIGFKVEFDVISTWSTYTLTDTMGAGLKYDTGSIKLYTAASSTPLASGDSSNDYYTLTTSGNGFMLELSKDAISKLASDGGAYITYTATVQSGATVANLTNSIKAVWDGGSGGGTGGGGETEDSAGITAGVTIVNVDASTRAALNGATFTICSDTSGDNVVDTVSITTGGTANSSKILKADQTYYLLQTKAPAGYQPLSGYIELVGSAVEVPAATLTQQTSYTLTAGDYTTVTVENTESSASSGDGSGIGLPTTGGMGTILFTVLGVLIMVGAASVIIRSRKQQQD